MTSKSSFFDLLKENFKRRTWTVALSALFFMFYFPIGTLLMSDMYLKSSHLMKAADLARAKRHIYNEFINMHQSSGYSIVIWLGILAFIMAFTGFAYLHESKKTDFYHSLPISRPKLFAVNVTNSIIIIAVPYFITAMLSAVIAAARSGYTDCYLIALTSFVQCLGFFLLTLMTAVLAVMLTGSRLVGIFGTGIFFFWGPVIITLTFAYISTYFRTYYAQQDSIENLILVSSPLFWAFSYGDISITVRTISAYIIAALMYFINMKLYMMRPSEAAGQAMVYKITKTPIKVIIVIPTALSCGLIFNQMMNGSDVWTLFAIVSGCIIIHCIVEIIYNLDFKKLFMHKIVLAGCLIGSLAIFAFFRFDISGFDSYMPDASKVNSAGIFSNGIENMYSSEDDIVLNENYDNVYIDIKTSDKSIVDRMMLTNISALQDIAMVGIEDTAANKNHDTDYIYANTADQDGACMSTVLVGWHLSSGKTVYRQYYMDLKNVSEQLESIIDSDEFREGTYPILADDISKSADLKGVNYNDALGFHHISFNGAKGDELIKQMEQLYTTYKSELSGLNADIRRNENPIITIQFKDSYIQSLADTIRKTNGGYFGQLNYTQYYPVYPSFTKTLALLNEYGVNINEVLNADDINTIVISDSRGYRTSESGETFTPKSDLIITDKDQIREILSCTRYDLNCQNSLYPQLYSLSSNAYLKQSYVFYGSDYVLNNGYAPANSYDMGAVEEGIVIESEADTEAVINSTKESTVFIDEISENDDFVDTADTVNASDGAALQTESYDEAADMYMDDDYEGYYYDQSVGNICLYFRADRIPDFVKDYFELSDEDIANSSPIW